MSKKEQEQKIQLTLEQLKDIVAGVDSKTEECDLDDLHILHDENQHYVTLTKSKTGAINVEIAYSLEGMHYEEFALDMEDYDESEK